MAVSLNEIYSDTKQKFKLDLLAGREGLKNTVSWVHLIEDVTTTDFIRGSELIITTGLGVKDEYWLEHFIESLSIQKAVGLIVNVGAYIKEIPPHTLEYCDKIHFPLFVMPWEIHLVDIMQDFCNRIIQAEQLELNESTAFLNSFMTPGYKDSYQPYLEQIGYKLKGSYCVVVIHPDKEIPLPEKDLLFKKFRILATNILNRLTVLFGIVILGQEIFIIFHGSSADKIQKYSEKLSQGFKKEFAFYKIRIGVGPLVTGADNICKSYKRGQAVLRIGKKQNNDIVFYDDIGINKVILAVEDRQVLTDLYQDNLSILENYDKQHNTDYLDILRLYLLHNSSVQAVADETFTHRNTINYRIKKIKELLSSDLDTMEDCFRFQLAFYIHDILEDSEN
ncbi:PucR family transcriptional regulator ligand-binding domain-containing protein [Anaerocolumna sp. AGMB13025]|uniref:PucR family transcriptional regulator n=1 Tax=Anaerocolumna sp. AGMB13025 TaxID=3039116 RepID=UPI00241C3FCC|nr:PucR family transcriptional regulator [Anaerocolumna sp. AGMB13025]WFR58451.1 PucR family transcriptional regulator ligand-binding domain-containing protein [Anaerocolumna sp. AGMB13025]